MKLFGPNKCVLHYKILLSISPNHLSFWLITEDLGSLLLIIHHPLILVILNNPMSSTVNAHINQSFLTMELP